MRHTLKFLLAGGVGLAAALCNQLYLSSRLQTETFVVATQPIAWGQPLTKDHLGQLRLAGDLGLLRASLIPWEDHAILLARPAPRAIAEGEALLRNDVERREYPDLRADEVAVHISTQGMVVVPKFLHVGQHVGFLLEAPHGSDESATAQPDAFCGTFRIAAINDETEPDSAMHTASNGSALVLTFGVTRGQDGLDRQAEELKRAIRAGRAISVVLFPAPVVGGTARPTQPLARQE